MRFKRLIAAGFLISNLTFTAVVFLPNSAAAAVDEACSNSSSFLGFPTWYKYLDVGRKDTKNADGVVTRTDDCAVLGPTNEKGDFDWTRAGGRILLAVFEIILRVGGILAVAYVTFGGFKYIFSQGEPDKIKGARSTIVNALIGLAIAASATAIVNLVGRNIT